MDLHELVPDEATIRILNRSSDLYQFAPDNLKKNYWVTLGTGEACDAAFDTMEEAMDFIKREALHAKGI
jgi:hypothetical protein